MVDTSVGVRELKQSAPKLLRRAERGETIVITRYGRPAAILGPPQQDNATTRNARLWAKEREAFERRLPKLERRYAGRYVAVCDGEVVSHDVDHNRLFERMWKRLRGRVFYIGRVGAEPPVIDMPGFEIDRS